MVKNVKCRICGKTYRISIKDVEWKSYCAGDYIQRALKSNTSAERELLISNTCESCWNSFFPEEDEEMFDDCIEHHNRMQNSMDSCMVIIGVYDYDDNRYVPEEYYFCENERELAKAFAKENGTMVIDLY